MASGLALAWLGAACADDPAELAPDGGVDAAAAPPVGDGGETPDARRPPDARTGNQPPVFEPVADRVAPLGLPTSFRVVARDPEGAAVTVAGAGLPAGSTFDVVTGTFAWVPAAVGEVVARFVASDGALEATLDVRIEVIDPRDPNPGPGEDPPPAECEAMEVPCGAVCCEPAQLCLFGACQAPGVECERDDACGRDEYCEPLVGRCLPNAGGEGVCQFVPPVGEFSPVEACRWDPNEGDPRPGRRDVVMAPVVANLSDDNRDEVTDLNDIPDIVFTTYNRPNRCCNAPGTIRIVSGRCEDDGSMRTVASIPDVDVDNSAGLALGDLTGNGVPEIVAILIANNRPQGTVAFTRADPQGATWRELWRNPDVPAWNVHTRGGAQPALADIDGDGTPDVVVGNAVVDGTDGSTMWDARGRGGVGNNAFLGPVSVVGDLDLDGTPEVVAGNTVYDAVGAVRWTFAYDSQNSPCGGDLDCDGYNGTANFDDDPEGEVVVIRRGEVFIFEHTGELKWKVAIPKAGCDENEAGPPTIADFDGDGRPEIGTAGADFYVVADPDCTGAPLPPECDSEGILWKVRNQDCSSRATASAVFDFEADGAAEVVYADETTLRIFRGADGEILFEDDGHGSHTRLEEPVIADVDNDGNAEVVIAGNTSNGGRPGIRVFEDADDNWVRTRRIWNQHGYHVSNVDERGRVPQVEVPHWSVAGNNNFRQNVQTAGVFNAPDLTVSLAVQGHECPAAFNFRLVARNGGSLAVPAGVAVTLYEGRPDDAAPAVIATLRTGAPLLIGGSVELRHRWPVPAGREGGRFDFFARVDDPPAHNECDETNNVAERLDQACDNNCPPGVEEPMDEVCNGVDDDCDGAVDEGVFRPCESVCGPGHERCVDGAFVDCSAAEPQPEVCDAVDNDCDGALDQGDDLCDPDRACVEGVCRERCPFGECPDDLVCSEGVCVEPP